MKSIDHEAYESYFFFGAKFLQNVKKKLGLQPLQRLFFLIEIFEKIKIKQGFELGLPNLKCIFMQFTKHWYNYSFLFIVLPILLRFNPRSFLGC